MTGGSRLSLSSQDKIPIMDIGFSLKCGNAPYNRNIASIGRKSVTGQLIVLRNNRLQTVGSPSGR